MMLRSSRPRRRRGFSLVELLAVLMVLAVLAGTAIPVYLNTRKAASGRACLGNIAAIGAAESAYALRNGAYATTIASLVGASEGLAETPLCPLTRTNTYTLTVNAGGDVTIRCTNDTLHSAYVGVTGDYSRTLLKPPVETLP
jgi:prepilin-type N-terminal cleavage/methylation domain-containing protein